jgi:hypothetical protein
MESLVFVILIICFSESSTSTRDRGHHLLIVLLSWFLSLCIALHFLIYILFCYVLIHFYSVSHFTRIPYFHIFCFDSLLFHFSLYQDPIFSHFLFWFTSIQFLTLHQHKIKQKHNPDTTEQRYNTKILQKHNPDTIEQR